MLPPPVGAAAVIFLGFSALFECEGGGLAVFGGRLLIGGRQAGDQMITPSQWSISCWMICAVKPVNAAWRSRNFRSI
jgi:hypothetical protein